MIENVKKLWKKELTRDQLIDFVLGMPEHNWIYENQYVRAHFHDFIERLPVRVLKKVFYEGCTFFARSTGRYACSVSNTYQNVIIIFPEVYKMLTKTYDGWAKAVLAHEIGHVYLEHAAKMEDPMEAQVDADQFACDMGYMDELESFLHEQPESVEKGVRLSFITTYYFANN